MTENNTINVDEKRKKVLEEFLKIKDSIIPWGDKAIDIYEKIELKEDVDKNMLKYEMLLAEMYDNSEKCLRLVNDNADVLNKNIMDSINKLRQETFNLVTQLRSNYISLTDDHNSEILIKEMEELRKK